MDISGYFKWKCPQNKARNNILSSQEITAQKLGIPCCTVKYANQLLAYWRKAEVYGHPPFSPFKTHAPEIFIAHRDYELTYQSKRPC